MLVGLGALALTAGCSAGSAARASSAPAVQTDHVGMPPSYRFEPDNVEVARGTTVTWTNSDNFTHSVQVSGQADVHVAKPGESVQIQFDQPGTYTYVCTFHTQNMRGTVVVR